jgi:hypothetical protein
VSRRWRPVKSKPGPGCLHSHCSVKFLSVMMLFGGEREGQTLSEVWRFHFGQFNRFLIFKYFFNLFFFSSFFGSATPCASHPPLPSILFPIIHFGSTTQLTGMTGVSLCMQWLLIYF